MKHYEVVAAVITRESPDGKSGRQIFCAQRPRRYNDDGSETETSGKWEFPGGKIESSETREQALVREITEEMDSSISVDSYICTVEHQYKTFSVTMHAFFCTLRSGALTLKEHLNSAWLTAAQLPGKDWAPADLPVVEKVLELQ